MSIRKWAERQKWAAGAPMPISFYSPSEWKLSVVGAGNADKAAVARVVWSDLQAAAGRRQRSYNRCSPLSGCTIRESGGWRRWQNTVLIILETR